MVVVENLVRAATDIARKGAYRINPELLRQYILGKYGALKNPPPAISTPKLTRWVCSYNAIFNRKSARMTRAQYLGTWGASDSLGDN